MCKSIGASGFCIIWTASTTIYTILFARWGINFVFKAVLATDIRSGLSISKQSLNFYKKDKDYFLANYNPSTIILGWTCYWTNLWLSFIISPIKSTLDVVPSPTISSCAVAALATIPAVGCCICISCNKTFPSFVSLICPAPPTSLFKIIYILVVPFGPRLLFMIYWSPVAALTFIARAWLFLRT